MKRIVVCALALALLAGCGFGASSYVVVTPHSENYGVAVDSDALTVSSYLSLKNALLSVVQDGAREAVLRAESYSGNLGEDLEQAVYEVSELSPLGAYAVNSMTYDYSRIVSYYEIHVNIAYKRAPEDLSDIPYVSDMDAFRDLLRDAMAEYAPRLVARIGDYDPTDMSVEVRRVYLAHPEFVLELPEVNLDTYPETGAQRILELKFRYTHTPQELAAASQTVSDQVASLTRLYASSNSELVDARRLYTRLGRDAVLDSGDDHGLENSAFSLLSAHHAGSYGFAQTYRLMLERRGLPCRLVTGMKDGAVHHWCLVEIDGASYYVDPSAAIGDQSGDAFLMDDAALAAGGYVLPGGMPQPAQLPEYLAP